MSRQLFSSRHLSISGIYQLLLIHQTLKVGSWDHVRNKPTVMVTFVQATCAVVTFVHISNISAVTGPILIKLFGPNFFGVKIFVDQNVLGQKIFKTQNFVRAQSFLTRNFIGPKKNFELKFPWDPKFFLTLFFKSKYFLDPQFFSKKISVPKIFWP